MARRKRTKEEIAFDLKTQSKVCSKCGERKAFTDYYANNGKHQPDGRYPYCKACDKIYTDNWKVTDKEHTKLRTRNSSLKFKYGIDQEEHEAMLEVQGGGCAVCRRQENYGGPYSASFCVDHDHKTNHVRGLLCDHCNRAIGLIQDNAELLRAAAHYLETH